MSKKSKKQRAKGQHGVEPRRHSGVVARPVVPPNAGGKVLELKRPSAAEGTTALEAARKAAPSAPLPGQAAEPLERPADLRELDAKAAPRPAAPPDRAPSDEQGSSPAPSDEQRPTPAPSDEQGATPAPSDEQGSSPSPSDEQGSSQAPSDEQQSSQAPSDEQRSSPRVSIAVDIHLSSDSHFFSGLSGDISDGGLFLSTYRPLTVGTRLDLELSLPGSDRALCAGGEVRWIRDHSGEQTRGVGVAFTDLSEEDRKAIHAFCASRPPLYYDDVG